MAESKASRVYGFVKYRIESILNTGDSGAQKAVLANMRRGIGQKPGAVPELWGVFLGGFPEDLYGKGQEPNAAEWAVYTALTLFAMHQQGHDPSAEPMHREKTGFGAAMAQLAHGKDDEERVRRKFNMAATASDIEEAAWHIKSAIQLLRAEGIPLDYAALARDLYRFQYPDSRESVQLEWGRDFYRQLYNQTKPDSKEDQNNG